MPAPHSAFFSWPDLLSSARLQTEDEDWPLKNINHNLPHGEHL